MDRACHRPQAPLPPCTTYRSRQGQPASPLRHQLLTPQHRKRTGHRPRQLLPQGPSFQTSEAASPVTLQLFQARFSLPGGHGPQQHRPSPPHRLVLWPPPPPCWRRRASSKPGQRSLLPRTSLSTNPFSTASERRMHFGTGCIINLQQI